MFACVVSLPHSAKWPSRHACFQNRHDREHRRHFSPLDFKPLHKIRLLADLGKQLAKINTIARSDKPISDTAQFNAPNNKKGESEHERRFSSSWSPNPDDRLLHTLHQRYD